MGKKKSNNGRKFVTCEVIGKKIKFPKKLRNKIRSRLKTRSEIIVGGSLCS